MNGIYFHLFRGKIDLVLYLLCIVSFSLGIQGGKNCLVIVNVPVVRSAICQLFLVAIIFFLSEIMKICY